MRFLINFIKKLFFLFLSIFVLFVVFILIWTSLPTEEIDISRFSIKNSFVFLDFKLNKNNISLLNEIINFKFGEEFLIESAQRRFLFKHLTYYFTPIEIVSFVNGSNEEDDFQYTFLIKSKKLSRFLDIPIFIYTKMPSFKKDYELVKDENWLICYEKGEDLELKSFAKYEDIIFFTTDKQKLKELINSLNNFKRPRKNKFQTFLKENTKKTFILYLEDKNRILDYYLEKAKEKTSYNFFPAISDLDEIIIYLDRDENQLKNYGKMDFVFKEGFDFKKAKKDIWFLSQILKRIFEANFYKFTYEIKIIENHVTIDFNLCKKGEEK